MERNNKLIKGKFYKYLLPGIMMVAAMQLGNLVDSIFVGNMLGTEALSAINLGMPVVQTAQLPILIMAVGGSIVSAISLGKRLMENASGIFSTSMIVVFIINVVNAIAALFYCKPLAELLAGGNGNALSEMTADFMVIYLVGMPFIGIGLMISYFMGVDNHPFESAALHIVANVINLISDYVFIQVLNLGMKGSALSTVVGYGFSGIFFGIMYLRSPKRTLKLIPSSVLKDRGLVKEAIQNGLSSGMIIVLSSVKMFLLNAAILSITGDEGMALYAVCVNSFFIVQLFLHGVSGVIQTICGVLYGEKDYYGIRVVLRHVITICVVVSIALMVLFIAFPGIIEGMFGFDLLEKQEEMDLCLRVFALSFIGYAFNNIFQTYYSTIEKPVLATLSTVLQGFVILVPVTLILLPFFGVVGTSIGAVVAETGAVVMVTIVRRFMYKKGKISGRGFDLLPEKQNDRFVDITIEGNLHNAANVAHEFKKYCKDEGISSRTANIISIAGEELVRNIAENNGKKRNYIDICLVKENDELVLRIRDNGPLYNPLESGKPDNVKGISKENVSNKDINPEIEELSEIDIIRKLAKKLDYSRVLDLNNTIVVVNKEIGG